MSDIDIKIKIFQLALRQAQGALENLYLKNYSNNKVRYVFYVPAIRQHRNGDAALVALKDVA